MPDHPMKRCRKCGEVKPVGEFYRDRSKHDGRRNFCRICERKRDKRRYLENRDAKLEYQHWYYETHGEAVRDYQLQYRETHPDKIRERDRRYYEANYAKIAAKQREYEDANREKINAYQRQRAARCRDMVLEHYGTVCACPGCYSTDNLGIDHVNGDGREHRKELFGYDKGVGGARFHYWLIKNNFPPGFQTLCSRCNTSKGTSERCLLDHDLEYDVENDAW